MSTRTPQQAAEDLEATRIAQSLISTFAALRVDPLIAVNALAGALGAYVAMAATEANAPALMRLMATQAREQMEVQLRLLAAQPKPRPWHDSRPMGRA